LKHLNLNYYYIKKTKDDRQNAYREHLKNELLSQPSKIYLESKQTLLDWLNQVEKSIKNNDNQLTYQF
jgi:hypothetical protein